MLFTDELLYLFRPDIWSILSDNDKDKTINTLIDNSLKSLNIDKRIYSGWHFGQNMSPNTIAECEKQKDGTYQIVINQDLAYYGHKTINLGTFNQIHKNVSEEALYSFLTFVSIPHECLHISQDLELIKDNTRKSKLKNNQTNNIVYVIFENKKQKSLDKSPAGSICCT